MTADARGLIADTRERLKPVEERMLAHPYLAAVEEGRVPREKLRLFAGEQYNIIGSDLRSIALLVSRHGHLASRDFLLAMLQGEAAAAGALRAFARALEMSEADLRAYEPMAGCQAYPSYVARLAAQGSDADFAAAFLVNLEAWGGACGRMSAALKREYGMSPDDVAFFDAFAQPGPTFEDDCLRVVQDGLDRGVDAAGIARAARLIQAYELMYWDTLHEASA